MNARTNTLAPRQGASMQRGSFGPYLMRNARGHKTTNGYAWTASIYRGGERIGTAEQTGTGGMTIVRIGGDQGADFDAFADEHWSAGSAAESTENFADALFAEQDILRRLSADRKKGFLPILLADDLPEIDTYDVLTAWRAVPGAVNAVPSVRLSLAARRSIKGALYFDGTSWVSFEEKS